MTAAQELKPNSFGLWSECPDNVSVAWGARAIADHGVGFSLLPDRQTWFGNEEDRNRFSALLNNGVLAKANETCRRLRHGWTPWVDLPHEEFIAYWTELRNEPGARELMLATGYVDLPSLLLRHLQNEQDDLDEYYAECESAQENRTDLPDPPKHCENDQYELGDDEYGQCPQKFTPIGDGEFDGCYPEDCGWICEECGELHPFDDGESDDLHEYPGHPILDTVRKLVGEQPVKMTNDKSETFTLYEDDAIIVKGNTNASYGYVYLIAYPKGEAWNF